MGLFERLEQQVKARSLAEIRREIERRQRARDRLMEDPIQRSWSKGARIAP